jgi:eukaryotic-like serine/threonine-protein kinase
VVISAPELRDQLQAALGDGYRIERELPPGGMSRLFLAVELSLDRQVVIKVLPPELTTTVSAARFQREITVAAQLQHPHILPILSAGASGSLLYYIMPYVDGESLRHRLTRLGRLPVQDALRILTETAEALARAHRAGVIHRDIKPENVLLQDGHALLADFGIARALRYSTNETPLTQGGGAPGTPAYMAPEQLAGEDKVDARTDVYALAIVGYEMLAGVSPFAGPTPQAIAAAHFKSTPRPLAALRPEVPRRVSDAISRALSTDPDARFSTVEEFRDALTGAGTNGQSAPGRFHLSTPATVLAIAGTALAALALAAVFVWRARTTTDHRPLDPKVIAVEPFTVLDPPLGLWREGMVDVLAHNLDGAGPLRTVAPTSIVHHAGRGAIDPVDFARAFGAGFAVTGRVEQSGQDSVRVSATLVNVTTGRPQDEVSFRGATDHMDVITDSLSVGLLRSISRSEPVGVARGSLGGARSLPALKALLESEQAYRRSDWPAAEAAADRAIQLDSTFALAYYWAGSARGWIEHAGDSMAAVYSVRAQALNHGLSPRDSLLVAANAVLEAPQSVNSVQLRQLFDAVAASTHQYPDDPQVWANLGELRFHLGYGREVGVPDRLAYEPFAHAIALDSDFAPAYEHATRVALELEGPAVGDRYARRFLRFHPPSPFGPAARLQIALFSNPRDTAANQRLIDSMSVPELVYTMHALYSVYDSAETMTQVARSLVRRVGPLTPLHEGGPAIGILLEAMLRRGHVRAVWSPTRPITPIFANNATVLAMIGDAGIVPVPTLDSILRRPEAERLGFTWFGLRWWAGRGDTTDIRRFLTTRAAQIGREDPDPPVNPAIYDTAAARAYLSLARHDTTDALRRFAALPDTLCHGGCALDAITYGELLTSHGQAAAADTLLNRRYKVQYSSLSDVLVQLALARAAARAGDGPTSRFAYERVADAWVNADPELQPAVTEARAALARAP